LVEKVGSNVSGIMKNDKVAVYPRIFDGICGSMFGWSGNAVQHSEDVMIEYYITNY
jgi:hypothetical protein